MYLKSRNQLWRLHLQLKFLIGCPGSGHNLGEGVEDVELEDLARIIECSMGGS